MHSSFFTDSWLKEECSEKSIKALKKTTKLDRSALLFFSPTHANKRCAVVNFKLNPLDSVAPWPATTPGNRELSTFSTRKERSLAF